MILAIETSCDDTCASVVDTNARVLSSVVSSQAVHGDFGGVVPEIAARHHLELLNPVVEEALIRSGVGLADIGRVAVTQGPGLMGALLVGVSFAKGLAVSLGLPLIAVDHLHGHIAASYLADPGLEPPFLCLVASGGHTLLVEVLGRGGEVRRLGSTLDDAAGEAFDKGARVLGLGYPGGPLIEKEAGFGDRQAFEFPRASGVSAMDFSFAGVKTSLLYRVREMGPDAVEERRADLSASYQAAIADQLASRVGRAVDATGLGTVAFGGGVAANTAVREAIASLGVNLVVPERRYCTDNAAMIGVAALDLEPLSSDAALALDAYSTGQGGLS